MHTAWAARPARGEFTRSWKLPWGCEQNTLSVSYQHFYHCPSIRSWLGCWCGLAPSSPRGPAAVGTIAAASPNPMHQEVLFQSSFPICYTGVPKLSALGDCRSCESCGHLSCHKSVTLHSATFSPDFWFCVEIKLWRKQEVPAL